MAYYLTQDRKILLWKCGTFLCEGTYHKSEIIWYDRNIYRYWQFEKEVSRHFFQGQYIFTEFPLVNV